MYKILAINPGSTSTKIALYEDEQQLMELTLRHSAEELAPFNHINEQIAWRRELILATLKEKGFDIKDLSVVIGRGGLVHPIPSGVYEVNDAMKRDLIDATMEHASNIGGLIASDIAAMAGVKAYIADPVVVDELEDIARISGLPQCPRISIFHALNQKAIARLHCEKTRTEYEKSNLIVVHLGGGISVGAHHNGRVIDVNNALNGDGPIAPERSGTLPAVSLIEICFSGQYTKPELMKMLAGKGGIVAHLGTNSMMEVEKRAEAGDQKAKLLQDAICYNVAKWVGSMACVLEGKVDAILITGGVAHNKGMVEEIRRHCAFIAPIEVYPGENELEALSGNALAVLRGKVTPKIYR